MTDFWVIQDTSHIRYNLFGNHSAHITQLNICIPDLSLHSPYIIAGRSVFDTPHAKDTTFKAHTLIPL